MPPGPIEGSCLPSPTAISFAPERSTSSVSASRRLWSTIPASSRMTVVSLPTWMAPVFARATSASRVSVCPASAGLSAPSRSAVDPDTATPIVSRPACCSARAAASITTPLPVPAGPTRTAARSGPVRTSSAWCCSGLSWSADALGCLTGGVLACDVADVSACGLGELCGAALDRLLLGANRQGGHPPALQGQHAPVADHLPRDGERLIRRQLAGGLLQRDRAQVALLEDGVLLGQLRLDTILDRALGCWPLGCADQPHGLIRAESVIAGGLCPHSL